MAASPRQKYLHNVCLSNDIMNPNYTVTFSVVSDVATPFTTITQVTQALALTNTTEGSMIPAFGLHQYNGTTKLFMAWHIIAICMFWHICIRVHQVRQTEKLQH